MLDKARASLTQSKDSSTTRTKFRFIQGSAEDLSQTTLQPESVDHIAAGTYEPSGFWIENMFKNFPYQNRLAQSGHWFDWSKVWPQVHRILRHGGTAAFWVYLISMPFESNFLKYLSFFKGLCRIQLPKHPTLAPVITEYAQGSNVHTSLGPHFQRPGRTILEHHLVDVPEPSSILKDGGLEKLHRAFFCGEPLSKFFSQK